LVRSKIAGEGKRERCDRKGGVRREGEEIAVGTDQEKWSRGGTGGLGLITKSEGEELTARDHRPDVQKTKRQGGRENFSSVKENGGVV